MSTNHSKNLPFDDRFQGGSLPPRHIKHGKRKQHLNQAESESEIENENEELALEEQEEASQEEKSVTKSNPSRTSLLIQIPFWALFAFILCIMGYWVYQQGKLDLLLSPVQNTTQVEEASPAEDPSSKVPIEVETGGQEEGVAPVGESETSEESESISSPVTDTEESHHNQGNGHALPAAPMPSTPSNEETKENGSGSEGRKQVQPKVIAEHVVQPGETFYRITMNYYGSRKYEDYLAEFNQISDKTQIKAGMVLKIPEKP